MLRCNRRRLPGGQQGFTFIEVLIGTLVLGIIIVTFLMAIVWAFRTNLIAQVLTTAESLARSQIEYIKSLPYADSYTIPHDEITDWESLGYTVFWVDDSGAEAIEYLIDDETDNITPAMAIPGLEGLQKIVIIVRHNEGEVSLEGYKALR